MLLREAPTQSLYNIANGARGTRQTLRLMSRLSREGKTHPAVREKAADLVMHIPGQEFTSEARELFHFVRDCVRYLRDVNGVETVASPDVVLEQLYGDCDDQAVLLAAMLESIGHPARFAAVGYAPGEFEHVYVETRIGDKWIALDPTVPGAAMGWSVFETETPRAVMRVNV